MTDNGNIIIIVITGWMKFKAIVSTIHPIKKAKF